VLEDEEADHDILRGITLGVQADSVSDHRPGPGDASAVERIHKHLAEVNAIITLINEAKYTAAITFPFPTSGSFSLARK
jgi:hypothetical protein